MGSWRKRYRAGRTLDIDLSPLLEVLERIDQIDTSMYGRKTTASATKFDENGNEDINNKVTCSTNLPENYDVKESEAYSSRRRRRLENRKRMENEILTDDQQCLNRLQKLKVSENITSRRHQNLKHSKLDDSSDEDIDKSLTGCLSAQNGILNKAHNDSKSHEGIDSTEDHKINGDDKNNKTEFLIFETCQKFEHVDVIEPIHLLQATGQTIADSSNGPADSSNDIMFKEDSKATGDINTVNLQRPEAHSSTENMIKYLKERRKSNYETFLAGLEPITTLKRCSTAEKDLVLSMSRKNIRRKISCSSNNDKCISNSNKKSSNDAINCRGEMFNKNIAHTNKEEEITQSNSLKIKTKPYSDSVGKYKHHSKVSAKVVDGTGNRFDCKNCEDNDDPAWGQVKFKTGSKDLDKMLPTEQVLSLNEGSIAGKHVPKQYTHRGSSNEEGECEKATFLDIKRRFENLCSGDSEKSEHYLNSNHSSKISNEHFRSQHLEMSAKRISSDYFENKTYNNGRNNEDNSDDTEESYKTIVSKDDDAEIDKYDSTDDNDETGCQNEEDIVRNSDDSQLMIELVKPANGVKPLEENSSENVREKTSNTIIVENKCENSLEILNQDQMQSIERNSANTSITVENRTSSDASNTNHSKGSKPSNEELYPPDIKQHFRKDCRSDLENSRGSSELFKNGEVKSKSSWDKVKQTLNAKAREKKYKQITDEEREDSSPDIQRIKSKLRRRPKYDDSDSDTYEKDCAVMELDGSNDEVVDLCWRTRGYDRDFYMSRKSVTGGEILDRYKRAVSNRRSKKRTRRVTESGKTEKENDGSCGRHRVSAPELMAALDRAANCSKRMTKRLKSQLGRSDSSNSSS